MDDIRFNMALSEIRDRMTMKDLCAYIGLPVSRGGFIECPFHSDSKPSCKVYEGSRGYYCFVCNQGGDVFDFVQKYYDTKFKDAVRILGAITGVDVSCDLPETDDIRAKHKARMDEKKKQEMEKQQRKDEYDKWLDLYVKADKASIKMNETHDISDEEAKLVRNKAYIQYRLDIASSLLHDTPYG